MFYKAGKETLMPVETASIAAAIFDAPAWALVSLTMADDQLRESGALELARWIARRLNPPTIANADQLALPLPANV
jgi:hypothetical protein